MSAQPESMPELIPPKAKRGRPARKVEQTIKAPELSGDTPNGAQTLPEFQCSIPMDTYYEMAINGQDRIKKHHYCTNEAEFIPVVTFIGEREEEFPPGSKKKVLREYTYKVRYSGGSGICKEHKAAIEKDVRVFLSPEELRSQTSNMANMGGAQLNPKRTKLSFKPFVPPVSEIKSEHLDALMGISDEPEED